MDAVLYWDMTYGEITVSIEGSQKRIKADMQKEAAMVFKLGELIGIAFNDPKKYPPSISKVFPKLFDEDTENNSNQQDWQIMKERINRYAYLKKKRGEEI